MLHAAYVRRSGPLSYSMRHEGGQHTEGLEEAEVVLVGVSRTSKSPTSIYLANRGVRTANVPIVPVTGPGGGDPITGYTPPGTVPSSPFIPISNPTIPVTPTTPDNPPIVVGSPPKPTAPGDPTPPATPTDPASFWTPVIPV